MSKKIELIELYDNIELTSTDDRIDLGKLKKGELDEEGINFFIQYASDAKGLDNVKIFEDQLLVDFTNEVGELEDMETELLGQPITMEHKKKAKRLIDNLDELMDAIKVAYLQFGDYSRYEERLYKAKEEIEHIV